MGDNDSPLPDTLFALVVDESEDVRHFVREELTRLGYTTTTAPNARAAKTILRDSYFDLIVTELMIPDADGVDVIADAKGRYPSTRVVAMTGGGTYLSLDVAKRMLAHYGAHTLLEKPFTSAQLESAVESTAAHRV
jgi:DNA-binding NtrC family response regulator